MSTIRVVNLQHTDATEPNIVLESDGTAVFASGITISGTTTLTVSGTAEFASGTAAAPKITFIDDNDTGIYSPAANNLGITTNGTAALTIDASQRVGIGTTNPIRPLSVSNGGAEGFEFGPGDTSGTNLTLHYNRSTSAYIGSVNQADFHTWSSGGSVEKMRLDSLGRLLVGTSSALPQGEVIQGAGSNESLGMLRFRNDAAGPEANFYKTRATTNSHSIVSNNDAVGTLNFRASDGSTYVRCALIEAAVDGTPGLNDMPGRLVFSTTADGASSPTERMRIDNSGDVLFFGNIRKDNASSSLTVSGGNGSSAGANIILNGQAGSPANTIQFRYGSSESMRIDSSGNVGIGTTSASTRLEVVSNTTPQFKVGMANDADRASLMHNGSDLYLDTTAGGLVFRGASNAERMRIDSSGNVGIGTTTVDSPLHIKSGSSSGAIIAKIEGATGEYFQLGMSGTQSYFGTYHNSPLSFWVNNSEKARLDTSGRLLVGTSTALNQYGSQSHLQVAGTEFDSSTIAVRREQNNANPPGIVFAKSRSGSLGGNTIVQDGDAIGALMFAAADGTDLTTLAALIQAHVDGTPGTNDMPGRLVFSTTADGASSPTERMRIDSEGSVDFGGTFSSNLRRKRITPDVIESAWDSTNSRSHMVFYNPNGAVGSISTSASATAYNTSSDYRLKENVVDIADGITRVKQLQPKRFNFIVDADTTVDGFLAHEAQAVVPEAITGTKDAVDDDGNPVYQGIDQSKLVPLLTAALQEAITKIETLEQRLTDAGL